MQKNYCPVKIKNPVSKNSLVRLLSNQKMHIIFDDDNFQDYKIDVNGNFLEVEKVSETDSGWMIAVAQKTDLIKYNDSTLYLGGINFYDAEEEKKASLCVVTNHENNSYLRVINPSNTFCTMSPNQVLDVVFYSDPHEKYIPYACGKDICLEMIQYYARHNKNVCEKTYEESIITEHVFRFRFDHKSIEFLSKQPFIRHDGGHILFQNYSNEKIILKIFCAWRGKDSIYKALLLPRIPFSHMNIFAKKQSKVCLKAVTELKKIDDNKLESGCNVLMSRA